MPDKHFRELVERVDEALADKSGKNIYDRFNEAIRKVKKEKQGEHYLEVVWDSEQVIWEIIGSGKPLDIQAEELVSYFEGWLSPEDMNITLLEQRKLFDVLCQQKIDKAVKAERQERESDEETNFALEEQCNKELMEEHRDEILEAFGEGLDFSWREWDREIKDGH